MHGCLMVSAEACLGIGAWALGLGVTIGFSTRLGLASEAVPWKKLAFWGWNWTYMFDLHQKIRGYYIINPNRLWNYKE